MFKVSAHGLPNEIALPFSAAEPQFSLLRPSVAQHHYGIVISLMIWAGWESWEEIWVCVNSPLSARRDEARTTNTDVIWTSFLAFTLDKEGWTQGSGFHQRHQLGTFHTEESPLPLLPLSPRERRGSSSENKVRQVGADDATQRACPGFSGRVALCPSIVRCADSCQEMETASGWMRLFKLPCHMFYRPAGEDWVEKPQIWSQKNICRTWIIAFSLLFLAFPWKFSCKCLLFW